MATKKGTTSRSRTPRGSSNSGDVATLRAMIADVQRRESDHRREIERLGGVVQQLTQLNSVECILTNGFMELSEKLAPLEDLSPRREPLKAEQAEYFRRLRAAMAQPDWSNATTLAVSNFPIDPIGVPPTRKARIAS